MITSTLKCGRSRDWSTNWKTVKVTVQVWSPWWCHQRMISIEAQSYWPRSWAVLLISNQDRLDNLSLQLLPQPKKRLSSTSRPQQMVSLFIAELSWWKTERLRRKSTSTSSLSDLLTNSYTSVVVNSKLSHWIACSKMMRNSDSLLLMVTAHCMLLSKETVEKSYKKSL